MEGLESASTELPHASQKVARRIAPLLEDAVDHRLLGPLLPLVAEGAGVTEVDQLVAGVQAVARLERGVREAL
eukprot:6282090-Alexandrium_andersonii.AAC.1